VRTFAGEKDLLKNDEMCPSVSPCAERFSESPRAAILTFHDRKHPFDGNEPWSVRRNEKQLYPGGISTMLESKGNVQVLCSATERSRQTSGATSSVILQKGAVVLGFNAGEPEAAT
jgi:hypothetical protein